MRGLHTRWLLVGLNVSEIFNLAKHIIGLNFCFQFILLLLLLMLEIIHGNRPFFELGPSTSLAYALHKIANQFKTLTRRDELLLVGLVPTLEQIAHPVRGLAVVRCLTHIVGLLLRD